MHSHSSDALAKCWLEELQEVYTKLSSLDFSGEKKKKRKGEKKEYLMVWGQYFYVIAEAIPLPPSMEMSIAVCHGPASTLAIPFAEGRTV